MAKRYVPQPLTVERRQKVRQCVARAKWKRSTSEEYKDAPHSYIRFFDVPKLWKFLADTIRDCGEFRTWKRQRYKYLILDGYCYWSMWPIVNRAKAETLNLDPKDWKPEF